MPTKLPQWKTIHSAVYMSSIRFFKKKGRHHLLYSGAVIIRTTFTEMTYSQRESAPVALNITNNTLGAIVFYGSAEKH